MTQGHDQFWYWVKVLVDVHVVLNKVCDSDRGDLANSAPHSAVESADWHERGLIPLSEHVVMLDDRGRPVGTAPKAEVHTRSTPLHLAFSCYVFDPEFEQVLLTQRAWTKQTWPGVWTNSCCGHPPAPDNIVEYVTVRVRYELGVAISTPQVVLPDFRYRATMSNGIVENEICPVYTATTTDIPSLNSEEVATYRWIRWDELCAAVTAGELHLSEWCMLQVVELAKLSDKVLRHGTPRKAGGVFE